MTTWREDLEVVREGPDPGHPTVFREALARLEARLEGLESCSYCGSLDWTREKHGRITHKHACPHRADAWCQTHPAYCAAAPRAEGEREDEDWERRSHKR